MQFPLRLALQCLNSHSHYKLKVGVSSVSCQSEIWTSIFSFQNSSVGNTSTLEAEPPFAALFSAIIREHTQWNNLHYALI